MPSSLGACLEDHGRCLTDSRIVPSIALVCWKPFPSGDTSKDALSDGLSIAQGVLICVRVKVPYTPN